MYSIFGNPSFGESSSAVAEVEKFRGLLLMLLLIVGFVFPWNF